MLAPPELVTWGKAAEAADLSLVDWKLESPESVWQKLVDTVAKADRARAVKSRDLARSEILELAKGSFWEHAVWPGHAAAQSARQVLQGAANALPPGEPVNAAWIDALRQSQATVVAARDLLNSANLPADSVRADKIIEDLATAVRTARHALDAPELVTAAPPPPPPSEGSGWGWLALGLLIAAAVDEYQNG